jgi:serine phosphatase RsbU (regulator of sigma subunit)
MKKRSGFIYLSCLILLLPFVNKGQQQVTDSLLTIAQQAKNDTLKALTYNMLAGNYEENSKYQVADSFAQLAIKYSTNSHYLSGLAAAYHVIGFIYEDKGEYPKELIALNKSLKLYKEIGDKSKTARLTANVGNAYNYQGSYAQALNLYVEALDMFTKTGDKGGMALINGNIANIYSILKEYKNALDYYSRAVDVYTELNDKRGIARNIANIGHTYDFMGDYDKAKIFFLKALESEKALDRKRGIEMNLESIAGIDFEAKDYDSSLIYYTHALALAKELEDKRAIAADMEGIGTVYTVRKNYHKAEDFLLQSLGIDTVIHRYEGIKSISTNLRDLYTATGQWQKAYKYYQLFEAAKDSLINEDKSKQIGRIEAKADYDKQLILQQAEDDKKSALSAAESKKQKLTILFVAVFALAIAVIAIIILRSLRITRRQKKLIEQQKLVVEEQKTLVEQQKAIVDEKNKDITDSIHYASRIQRALLTTDDYIGKRLKEYFILFKPRDIVSGDFYWANEVETNEGKRFLICAGDCTGHGVPGAFMSLLNISLLNEVNLERKINEPAKILDEVREHIIKALNPEGKDEESKDGMDCILCSFDLTNKMLDFACANNPLWLVRNNECIEYKADKMPVGIQDGQKPFSAQTLKLQVGDMIYMFTDGYADQFGGPKGKKFKYKQLQEKLLEVNNQPMAEQKHKLKQAFEDWKNELEQIDDVLLIGIRV